MANRPALFTKADLRRFFDVANENGKTVGVRPDGTLIMLETELMSQPDNTPTKEERRPRSWSR